MKNVISNGGILFSQISASSLHQISVKYFINKQENKKEKLCYVNF